MKTTPVRAYSTKRSSVRSFVRDVAAVYRPRCIVARIINHLCDTAQTFNHTPLYGIDSFSFCSRADEIEFNAVLELL